MDALVECRSGSSYPETPVALTWEGRRREVREILERWRSPQGIHFRVQTEDGQVFELMYEEQADRWQIHQP